ncbi:DUF1810 domain-containing protein [Bradyrhizobium sp. U87765 SZCCT0131]|uniref:DUF1810 domain-containing protein n=1 Tax=unclassified Bradyrhizobium TaxID=2631580 RepID=UPI001BA6C426|nr:MULTISPECIES: DUF1810 domain-containing protein [unclassified Bradyrhizobium]MBR1217173.1 DUF1810 domain-containing protein [Bradyrhizobium sp. U87765 SZCCT0131]MBR1259071.1 DUF1810 domain-containing protein [Bradyrhizobium sp. U87765 SZCCT0134]MBR1305212.1 DUF1810 domain-containing protein [Bradyrhizobium sp. U87765 SZCCT0110]MBR1320998.1 DUF1810 domain-containing protein [Bradyrhizobium sp. U87765 SZCCT0109]MBR1350348.1 DUF1810 domain-containing protein [Bradyrhizobium sp. U87765 SZCCT004
MDDHGPLQRFVEAQDPVWNEVLAELRAGAKRTHWMWFVFPQIAGLGHSPMARRYAISSELEATSYLRHPILGTRLRTCTQLVLAVEGRSATQIFGTPDDLKLHSSMTLFALAAGDEADDLFRRVIDKYFAGALDAATRERL